MKLNLEFTEDELLALKTFLPLIIKNIDFFVVKSKTLKERGIRGKYIKEQKVILEKARRKTSLLLSLSFDPNFIEDIEILNPKLYEEWKEFFGGDF